MHPYVVYISIVVQERTRIQREAKPWTEKRNHSVEQKKKREEESQRPSFFPSIQLLQSVKQSVFDPRKLVFFLIHPTVFLEKKGNEDCSETKNRKGREFEQRDFD